ncbi:MAG: ttg2C [Verrucomicrobiales bacterium]|nr:ttg2C [Verrucomicrobiales bacterium]
MKRLHFKVGIFVAIGLTIVAALMLVFSHGLSFSRPTYTILMKAETVGGLKVQAPVLLAGVQIGSVIDINLAPDGKAVVLTLKLDQNYKIHNDAKFAIDSLGLLGDQFVAIRPQANAGPLLKEKEMVSGEPPFDLQEVARASLGFIHRVDETAQRLNSAIKRIDEVVLAQSNLLSLSDTIHNFNQVSESAIQTVEQIGTLFKTNEPAISGAVSNLAHFSGQLNKLADELSETVFTNRTMMTRAMNNLENASRSVTNLLGEVEAGRGVAGALLKDREMKETLSETLSNARELAFNLNVLSSNVNNKGLWRVLWKPKATPPSPPKNK